jgi:hypothetical protein
MRQKFDIGKSIFFLNWLFLPWNVERSFDFIIFNLEKLRSIVRLDIGNV